MIKHPNCSTRAKPEKCGDLYCPIHGRIRNMDAGASPFVDSDAVFQEQVQKAGLTEEDVLQIYRDNPGDPDPLAQRLYREAQEADARIAGSFDAIGQAIPEGCLCTWSNNLMGT